MFRRLNFAILVALAMFFFFSSSVYTSQSSAKKVPRLIPPETSKMKTLRMAVDAEIDALSARLIEMNDWMYHNPESGFLEFKASALLVEELKKNGFEVEMGVPGLGPEYDKLKFIGGLTRDYSGPPGLPTAFKARYKGKTEHPAIGFIVEYDALRGDPPFHGCQHNMQGPTGVGAAIALAEVMEKNNIPGSVWVIGAPSEEAGPPPKEYMAKTGYFNGIDFMLRSHGTARETLRYPGGFSSTHLQMMKYTFHGKSSHANSAWDGVSALDAVFLLFHGIDMIREHSEPQFRFHGVVSDGGVAANIVPDLASATVWIRHHIDNTPLGSMSPKKAKKKIDDKVIQLNNIAKGAALATGTTVDVEPYTDAIPGIGIGILEDLVFQLAVDYGGINIGQRAMPNQWEETGFGTLLVPGIHVRIGTEGIPEVPGHHQSNADITISPEGHSSLILTSKVMGAVALRLAMDDEIRKKAKEEHAMWFKKYNE